MEKTVKKRKGTGGFTLVELIVVIAILAILAGVGTVAYTGYITATRKGVDRQTVGDLMYAAQLADYANPSLFSDNVPGYILITESGTETAGLTRLDEALEDSVGDLNQVSLNYGDWTDKNILSSMSDIVGTASTIGLTTVWNSGAVNSNGDIPNAAYADNADELWSLVEQVAEELVNRSSSGTAGVFLAKAANYTINSGIATGNEMGNAWQKWSLANQFTLNESVLEQNGAVLATQMARNHAFAEYLKSNNYNVSSQTIQYFQNGGDLVSYLQGETPGQGSGTPVYVASDWATLRQAASDYMTKEEYTGESSSYTQAYVDGMTYFGLMYNVDKLSTEDDNFDPASDDYMDKIGSIVSMTGQILSGSTGLESLNGMINTFNTLSSTNSSAVLISAKKTDGNLNFKVTPSDADPRDGDESSGSVNCTESHSETLTVQVRPNGMLQFFVDGASANSTLVLCSIDSNYSQMTVTYSGTAQASDVTFTPADPTIISVEGNTVTALRAGTTTLTVTHSGGKEAQITVVVH